MRWIVVWIGTVMKMILLLVLLAILAVFYAFRIEPYRLTVKTYPVGEANTDTLRVVQVSDIQIGESYTLEHLADLIQTIQEQNPDFLLFTGDLYENFAQYNDNQAVIEALSQLKSTYGNYAVWGNRDYGGGAGRHYEEIMKASGFVLLKNEGLVVETESGQRIYLAGIDDGLLGNPDFSAVKMADPTGYDYRILMVHEPDLMKEQADMGFDLVLAGHSHGGQVRIPFVKGITTSLAEIYTRGFYDLGGRQNTQLYVNAGIGTSHYPVRFGVVPEISVFTIGL